MLNTIRIACRSSRAGSLLRLALLCCWALAPSLAPAAPAGDTLEQIRAFRSAHEQAILDQLTQLLAIPNVASDRRDIHRNAEAIALLLRQRGLTPRLLEPTGTPDAPPLVYAQWRVPGAKHTLVLYAHYDGQPVNPTEWVTPPWTPTLRNAPQTEGGRVIALDSPGS